MSFYDNHVEPNRGSGQGGVIDVEELNSLMLTDDDSSHRQERIWIWLRHCSHIPLVQACVRLDVVIVETRQLTDRFLPFILNTHVKDIKRIISWNTRIGDFLPDFYRMWKKVTATPRGSCYNKWRGNLKRFLIPVLVSEVWSCRSLQDQRTSSSGKASCRPLPLLEAMLEASHSRSIAAYYKVLPPAGF